MAWLKKLLGAQGPRVVTLMPSQRRFEAPRGETVLERALKEGIPYPHDCTVGTCGTCRSRLLEGRVEAITPFGYTLSREELDAGYILACQALAKSDLVLEVEIADRAMPKANSVRATLVALEDLTHDIKRATFELAAPIDYLAGQYVNITWPGEERARSYSFSQRPAPGGRTRISTFVRRVPGGGFTEHLFAGAPFDVPYDIDGPHGNFWLRDGEGPILCIAGGSGLAPIISLLDDAAERGVARNCVLLFGARTERDLYVVDEIASLEARWPTNFAHRAVLSEQASPGYDHGLVTAFIEPTLQQLGPGVQAYLCGPPPMIDAAIEELVRCGVALSGIHYDRFTDASSRELATA